ncbi:MAG: purine-nucleoside phosphorylase [Gammaproteobacteria bacterium TMED180]|nr:MAG: purine-nucleoside phosphorylase [Gammaproteobacteria bacterium TMED180]
MTTPHIEADPKDIAPLVLLPGDPLRAKFIAQTYLDDVKLVTQVRNMLGYTGSFNSKRVSVLSSGMGMPSMAIYATELVRAYKVKTILRVGSCGSIDDELNIGQVVATMGASTDSNMNRARFGGFDFAATADFEMLTDWVRCAELMGADIRVGNVLTSDTFYHSSNDIYDLCRSLGILAVEMEAAALYRVAAEHRISALAVMTVSDHILKQEAMSPADRETTFKSMAEISLKSITNEEKK